MAIMFHTNKLNLGQQCKIERFLIVTAGNTESEKRSTVALENTSLYLKKGGYRFNISLNFAKNNNHDRMLFSPNRDAKWKK